MTGLKFENFYCKKGNIKDEISKLAKELDAYAVIIGAAGESSVLEDLFVGLHTKDIIRGKMRLAQNTKGYYFQPIFPMNPE